MNRVKYFDVEDLLLIATVLGVKDVRDLGLLDSAALRPQSVVFGSDAYPTLAHKAAALMESIVGNHPLVDGNKRLGWAAVVGFYSLNGIEINISDDTAFEFVVDVAAGRLEFEQLVEMFEAWTSY